MSRLSNYMLTAGFLLIIFATRIPAIDHFPVFIDEALHIFTTEKVTEISPLYNVSIGRVLSIWWLWLFQPTQSEPIWIARVAMLIIILPGITALLQLAYRISGHTALILMGLFLLFSPYHFFFERLALADPVAASFVLVAIAAGYRLGKRFHYVDAILCGGFLASGILAKSNVIPYAGVILAATVAFAYRHHFSALIRWFFVALSALLIPVIGFEVLVRITGNAWLLAIINYVQGRTGQSASPFERVAGNIFESYQWFIEYMHPVMVFALALALIGTIYHRRVYLLLVLIAPMLPMWIGEPQETRYWLVPIGLSGLILAIEVASLLKKSSWKMRLVPLIAMLIQGAFVWLPQVWITANNPVATPLAQSDIRQYIYPDATGFGFEQIPDYIPADNRPQILGLLANCQGLRFTYWMVYEVFCQNINSDGSDIPALIALVDDNRGIIPYVVLENSSYIPATIEGEIIGMIERPDNRGNLTIIDIRP